MQTTPRIKTRRNNNFTRKWHWSIIHQQHSLLWLFIGQLGSRMLSSIKWIFLLKNKYNTQLWKSIHIILFTWQFCWSKKVNNPWRWIWAETFIHQLKESFKQRPMTHIKYIYPLINIANNHTNLFFKMWIDMFIKKKLYLMVIDLWLLRDTWNPHFESNL